MRASELLGPYDTPELRVRLLPVVPELVPVRRRPRWLRPVWPKWAGAMALPGAIYLRPDQTDVPPAVLGALVAHELVHVRQWHALGLVGFLRHYLVDYLRGRRRRLGHRGAYRAIGLEAEAYDIVSTCGSPASPPPAPPAD